MSATWEYEDSDIYVADRRECEEPGPEPEETRDAFDGFCLLAWTIIAAYCVGGFIALLRAMR